MAEIVARGFAERQQGREERSREQLERLEPAQLQQVAKRLAVGSARATKRALVTAVAPVLGPRWWGLRKALNKEPNDFASWLERLKKRPGNYLLPKDAE